MAYLIVGVDPDAVKHGIALYRNKKLVALYMWDLWEIMQAIDQWHKEGDHVLFSVENVAAQNFTYTRNEQNKKKPQAEIARKVGQCQQSQHELCRILDHLGIEYILHRPQRGNWSENKARFQQITGWTTRSNKDTRSAAFFGYLALTFKPIPGPGAVQP